MSGQQQQPETAQDVFRDASFGSGPASSSSSSAQFQPDTAQSIFAGAGGSTAASNPDLSHLHPIAKMSSQELDYIALEDDRLNELEGTKGVLPSRGWGDELCYGTGSTYLAGLAAGGVWGFRDGLFRPVYNSKASLGALSAQQAAVQNATAPGTGEAAAAATAASGKPQPLRLGTPFRLRLNTVLNAVTSRGTFVGNNAGVLALIYNGINSSIDKYRGKHDIYGSMVAGAGTGAIWRSTAGFKPMVIASIMMTGGAAAWTSVKHYII